MEPSRYANYDLVEIKFKNTRKEFFRNSNKLDIHPGEPVVLEAPTGYDIGIVSMLGELVNRRMRIKKVASDSKEIINIVRKPNQAEIEKWQDSLKLESSTMLKARHIATELKLNMKISDVEYQADGSKATFYYTADERVDFRALIRHLADQFKVRVEMRQIGARQEAGRLGGIGSCGRELCCSTWLTDFRSVSTNAARYQQLSINPQKLAGNCGKLKCCLNFELDSYLDAIKGFPSSDVKLQTAKGKAYCFKSDIFKGLMWYSYLGESNKVVVLPISRVHEIIEMNKKEEIPEELESYAAFTEEVDVEPDFGNVVGQDSLTRFDAKLKNKGRAKGNRKRKPQAKKEGAASNNQQTKPEGQSGNKPKPNNRSNNKNGPKKDGQPKSGNPQPKSNKPKADVSNSEGEGDEKKPRPKRNNRNKNNQNRKPKPSGESKE
ncbi:MAG: cell fate regulator YaaT (PSP1 superfamily) [Halieaceae bacterium]|jgi:cell fate regulator YaaT (PSP1 superfamily)